MRLAILAWDGGIMTRRAHAHLYCAHVVHMRTCRAHHDTACACALVTLAARAAELVAAVVRVVARPQQHALRGEDSHTHALPLLIIKSEHSTGRAQSLYAGLCLADTCIG